MQRSLTMHVMEPHIKGSKITRDEDNIPIVFQCILHTVGRQQEVGGESRR